LSDRVLTGAARLLAAAAFGLALLAGGTAPGMAAKATPAPSTAPSPAPTPTREPLSSAIPRLQERIRANPDDYDSMTQLAQYYMEARRPDLALPLTTKLIAAGKKSAQIYYIDGVANQEVGKNKEALASLEQAANYEPTNAQVLLTLTQLYMQSGRGADAERVAKRATTFNKDDEHAWITYGLVFAQENKFDDARTQFETAAKLAPKDPEPLVLIARSYIDQKAYPNALVAFDQALAVDPKNSDALQGKAAGYLLQNDAKDAIATYDKLYDLAPDEQTKVAVLGTEARVYATNKQPAEAEAVLKRAIAQYPAVSLGHDQYGIFLMSQNRGKEAEQQFIAGAGPTNDNRDSLMLLGAYYMSSNQVSKGIVAYKRVTELTPADSEALIRLAQAYSQNRQFTEARDAYRRAFEARQEPVSLAGIAVADCALKNYKEGTQIFDALNQKLPGFAKQNPEVYLVMGECYTEAGQKAKAKVVYTQLLAYTKPGSSEQKQVQKLIADLDRTKPAAATPKPSASPKH
jgi:tetratricopeptide (TPR) repeat protein